jgi:hypothetical protein
VKKFLVTLFVAGLLGSAVAAGGASAAVTPPWCFNYGHLHVQC